MGYGWGEGDGERMIRLATIYFAAVFGAGFVLGILRVMFLVSQFGRRYAELIEIPLMLLVIYVAARWVAQKSNSQQEALRVGMLALAMLLSAEVLLAAVMFGKWPMDALLNKDPVSGTAYYLSLLVFAVLPSWVRGNMSG